MQPEVFDDLDLRASADECFEARRVLPGRDLPVLELGLGDVPLGGREGEDRPAEIADVIGGE
ncbi:MAG: hypothetical protein R2849_22730 [Thermomicrobiales bacterium]